MTRVMGYCLFSFFKCGIFSCYAIFVHCLTNSRVCLPVRCRICMMSSNTLKYCKLFVGHCRGIWIDWLSCVLLVDWIEWCLLCVLFIHLLIHWSIDPLIHWSIDPFAFTFDKKQFTSRIQLLSCNSSIHYRTSTTDEDGHYTPTIASHQRRSL